MIAFPRLVLYATAQTAGASLGGLLLRRGFGSRNFRVGEYTIDTELVPVSEACWVSCSPSC